MIHAEVVGDGIWHVQLRRPEKRNAMGETMYLLFADMFGQIQAKPDARVIVLSGEGEAFCAGNDLAEFATHWPQPPHGSVVRSLEALHGLDMPVVAAVQGPAVGIGATLLLHCDLVVAAPGAFLQFPFVDLGITVEGAGSHLLPLRLGYARAMEVLLTGRRVYADEAHALGLVTHVSRERPPINEAFRLAQVLAAKPPAAVRATKRLVRKSLSETMVPRFEEEIDRINELITLQRSTANTGR